MSWRSWRWCDSSPYKPTDRARNRQFPSPMTSTACSFCDASSLSTATFRASKTAGFRDDEQPAAPRTAVREPLGSRPSRFLTETVRSRMLLTSFELELLRVALVCGQKWRVRQMMYLYTELTFRLCLGSLCNQKSQHNASRLQHHLAPCIVFWRSSPCSFLLH